MCKKIIYINPAPCVSVIPIKNSKILLCIRGIEPRIGTYDFIGGFVNVGETIKEAALRETLEETGLTVKLDKYLGEYQEEYLKNITYPLVVIYTAKIIKGVLKAGDDVSKLEWIKITDINKLNLKGSFPGIKKTLNNFVKFYVGDLGIEPKPDGPQPPILPLN